ncbi:MAG TPA: hypothetical protein VII47_15060 [Actinomycetota bacterium]|jgi:hypothetical protein
MGRRWVEAGGEIQIPCMVAAGKVLRGEQVMCPRCGAATLRYYFHAFDPREGRGTLWVWCPACGTTCHLPRVVPNGLTSTDPFADLDLEAFAELELSPDEGLLDRLDRMWDEGVLP